LQRAQVNEGQWIAGFTPAIIGQTDLFTGLVGNDFYMTQPMLHSGIVKIPFEKLVRDINSEIILAFRYFEKMKIGITGRMNGGGNATHYGKFTVLKRDLWIGGILGNPVIGTDWFSEYGSISTGGTVQNPSIVGSSSNTTHFGLNIGGTSGTSGHATYLASTGLGSGATFDSEL